MNFDFNGALNRKVDRQDREQEVQAFEASTNRINVNNGYDVGLQNAAANRTQAGASLKNADSNALTAKAGAAYTGSQTAQNYQGISARDAALRNPFGDYYSDDQNAAALTRAGDTYRQNFQRYGYADGGGVGVMGKLFEAGKDVAALPYNAARAAYSGMTGGDAVSMTPFYDHSVRRPAGNKGAVGTSGLQRAAAAFGDVANSPAQAARYLGHAIDPVEVSAPESYTPAYDVIRRRDGTSATPKAAIQAPATAKPVAKQAASAAVPQSVRIDGADRVQGGPGSRQALLNTMSNYYAMLMGNPGYGDAYASADEVNLKRAQTKRYEDESEISGGRVLDDNATRRMTFTSKMIDGLDADLAAYADVPVTKWTAEAKQKAADRAKYRKLLAQQLGDYPTHTTGGAVGHASGGAVGYAGGGMIEPAAQPDMLTRQYGQYVSSAMQAGVQPLSMDKFTALLLKTRMQMAQAPAQAGAPGMQPDNPGSGAPMGFAGGGAIDVAGRQVLGPGDGKSDSIPAVIDGQQPAKLSTGEFVFPVEAVQFFGMDRLNKMVAAARKQGLRA